MGPLGRASAQFGPVPVIERSFDIVVPGMRISSVLFAALAAFAAGCSRPPRGMRRLDAGDVNHRFRLDRTKRRLFYIEGDGDLVASRLGVVDLETGDRKSYRFSPERIVALRPSPRGESVAVAVENDDDSEDGDYQLLKVDAATGRVLLRKASDSLSEKDFAAFDGPAAPVGEVYTIDRSPGGPWRIERFEPKTRTRRTVASFAGRVESLAGVGTGLAVLRRREGVDGPRLLDIVDASGAGVELELPWSNEDSEILGADTAKRLLYVRMNEGERQTCWAVRFDEKTLRAASAYLTAARAPGVPKLTATDLIGIVVIAGMLVVLFALLAGAGG